MSASRWLVTGATGLLAPYLVEACGSRGAVVSTARSGGDVRCDLSQGSAAASLVKEARPHYVLHTAAMTDVDACEARPDAAFSANRDSTANLAAAMSPESLLIYFSTDQVYPDTAGPHGEDAVGPVNTYGRSKLAGEEAARAQGRTLVLRTNFFGPSRTPQRSSLSDFIVESLGARRDIVVFEDVLFSPLHMTTLARLAVDLAEAGTTGTYNAGSRDGASKARFALCVARHLSLRAETARSGRSDLRAGRAPRPHDLRMDVSRLERKARITMPTLAEEICKL